MSKIIVTGGSGLVGKHLKEILPNAIYLSSKDCDLTDISKLKWCKKVYRNFKYLHLPQCS